MRGYVGVTDHDWFTYLRALQPPPEEVNFWRPGGEDSFLALEPGAPFFFKLKAPRNAIGGFGYFAHFSRLPVSMAWDVYEEANGAPTFPIMRERLERLRARHGMERDAKHDFWIGCILINQPVFFGDDDWVRLPSDWAPNIVRGKTYDLTAGEGQRMWLECLARAGSSRIPSQIADRPIIGGFGAPTTVRPRLGQRSFRIAVLDVYDRRCAVTSERTLPALEAAHIREFHDVSEHAVNNGILFRADIHKLFDRGYVTVTPDYRFEVSKRIKEEFENGRDYYRLSGTPIRLPEKPSHHPLLDALAWHNEQRFLG